MDITQHWPQARDDGLFQRCPLSSHRSIVTVQFCIYFPSSASTRQSINIKFLCVFCKEQYLHCYICLHSWPPIADRRTSIQAWTRSHYSCFFMLMQHWMSEQDPGQDIGHNTQCNASLHDVSILPLILCCLGVCQCSVGSGWRSSIITQFLHRSPPAALLPPQPAPSANAATAF